MPKPLECYKEEIEANLRTSGLGGFQLLDLHDYLGQGTALVGQINGETASTAIDGDPNTFVLAGDPKAPFARAGRTDDHFSLAGRHGRSGANAAAKPSRA